MHLFKMTYKSLKTVAGIMEIKGRSSMDKNALIGAIGTVVNMQHSEALEMNASIKANESLTEDLDAMDQIRAWWERQGLGEIRPITADHIIAARTRDHVAALAQNYLVSFAGKHLNRVNGYHSQNKGGKTTSRQSRRIEKKVRRAIKTAQGMARA